MKKLFLLILFALFALPLCAQQKIPWLNQKIVEYVSSVMGKKVERGECWDLAKVPLVKYNADWDFKFRFGREVNPKKDTIYPGDIIQFYNVKLKYTKDGQNWTETMVKHTAIIYQVPRPGEYRIAHQNTGFTGRKVGVSDLRLSEIDKGKILFYRPEVKK